MYLQNLFDGHLGVAYEYCQVVEFVVFPGVGESFYIASEFFPD